MKAYIQVLDAAKDYIGQSVFVNIKTTFGTSTETITSSRNNITISGVDTSKVAQNTASIVSFTDPLSGVITADSGISVITNVIFKIPLNVYAGYTFETGLNNILKH
jgi:hypothetical protein